MTVPKDVGLKQLYRDFISGCHILHYHCVLDAYGHLSVRHPAKPDIFIMSRYIAPGTIASESDLIEYYVDNAEPVDPTATKGYSERCIHSEVYKRYTDVHSVIHSHSEAVVPYGISGVPLQPCFHMAGFLGIDPHHAVKSSAFSMRQLIRRTILGAKTPIYDISDHYKASDTQDMLVRNTHLGAGLAALFSESADSESKTPDHAVVLMRGHGLTVIAPNIQECVLRAVYTQKNASIQTTALITRAAHFGSSSAPPVKYLNTAEAAASAEMTAWSAMRPWGLWVREVEAVGLYVNLA